MEVTLSNPYYIAKLNNLIDEFFAVPDYNDPKYIKATPNWNTQANPEYWCSEDYLRKIIARKDDHKGFPEEGMAQPIEYMVERDNKWLSFRNKAREEFTLDIGAQHAALTNYYPPGGFVGWHTNWNASAYQILFTWSRTGEGYFRYLDLKTNNIVTIEDKPGWQCRWYYFGRQAEIDHHCWHSAYTYCDRFTLAYKFDNGAIGTDKDKQAQFLRDELINELESTSQYSRIDIIGANGNEGLHYD